MTQCREPYPETEPYRTGFLDVGDGHTLYFSEHGNKDGIPVVWLHGGPGGHSKTKHTRFFNPERYRIILLDQRGCGQSTPRNSLVNNTTAHLVADLEKLRTHLNIDQWIVFGGSWGSTLGIAYCVAHPSSVKAAVLNGIFLGSAAEADGLYGAKGLAAAMFPAEYKRFLEPLTDVEKETPFKPYIEIIANEHDPRQRQAVRHWARWESQVYLMDSVPEEELEKSLDEGEASGDLQTMALFETFYIGQQCFLDAEKILKQLSTLNVPAYLFHGRLDMICPPVTAQRVHEAWRNSQLTIIPNAGHDSGNPVMQDALLNIMDSLAEKN